MVCSALWPFFVQKLQVQSCLLQPQFCVGIKDYKKLKTFIECMTPRILNFKNWNKIASAMAKIKDLFFGQKLPEMAVV